MVFRMLLTIFIAMIVAGLPMPGVSSEHYSSATTIVSNDGLIGKRSSELSDGKWINSQPLKLSDLRGKVVLLEFWTFGCYNCRNTVPYLKNWYEKYGGKEFTIVGVHSPELEREKEFTSVARQTRDLGIKYPVVTDNELLTWSAYDQEYWPVLYLIDKKGIVRYVHVGEGDYPDTERWIQKLLEE